MGLSVLYSQSYAHADAPAQGGGINAQISNWATQFADQGSVVSDPARDRARDLVDGDYKWTGVGRVEDWEVRTVTGRPYAKGLFCTIVQNVNPSLYRTGWTWGPGSVVNIRVDMKYLLTEASGAENDGHGYGNEHGISSSNWTYAFCYLAGTPGFFTYYLDTYAEAYPNRRWGPWGASGSGYNFDGAFPNNNPPNGYHCASDHYYTFETQLIYVSATHYRINNWVDDAEAGTPLFTPSDYYNQNGSVALLGRDIPFANNGGGTFSSNAKTQFLMGKNGLNFAAPFAPPYPYVGYAGHAMTGHDAAYDTLAEGQRIGAYGSCIGET